MLEQIVSHPDVELIWNIWPLSVVVITPIREALNFLFALINIWVWWVPVLWNLLLENGTFLIASIIFGIMLILQIPFWLFLPLYLIFFTIEWIVFIGGTYMTTTTPTQVIRAFATLAIAWSIWEWYIQTSYVY